MLKNLIKWSIHNRFLVIVATIVITGWGWVSLQQTPLDAIPALSDVQVIIKTNYPSQSPRVVEDQVTYPNHYYAISAESASGAWLFFLW